MRRRVGRGMLRDARYCRPSTHCAVTTACRDPPQPILDRQMQALGDVGAVMMCMHASSTMAAIAAPAEIAAGIITHHHQWYRYAVLLGV